MESSSWNHHHGIIIMESSSWNHFSDLSPFFFF
jgi:hypothetical protein